MSERFKTCDRCGSEFVPTMESCIDCGGPLVETDLRMTPPPSQGTRQPPPPPDLTTPLLSADDDPRLVREEDISYVQPLAQRLRAEGIRCDVIQDCKKGCAGRVALWVPAADLAAAAAMDREHFADLVPDAASFVDLDGDGCPACGTPRSPGKAECSDCGLTLDFGAEEAGLAL